MLPDTNAKSGRDLNIIISFWIKFFGPDFIKTVAAKRVEWWLKRALCLLDQILIQVELIMPNHELRI